jgi:hypothetical protein
MGAILGGILPSPTAPTGATSIHGPYEDAIIAGCEVLGKLIDGQTPAQKAQIWQNLINIGQPFLDAAVAQFKIWLAAKPAPAAPGK